MLRVRPLGLGMLLIGVAAWCGMGERYGLIAADYVAPRTVTKADRTALEGTALLTAEGDLASQMIDGIDRFLLKKIEESTAKRDRHWKRDFSSREAYEISVAPNRQRLARMFGIRDARVQNPTLIQQAAIGETSLVGRGTGAEIHAVRWPVLEDPDPHRADAVVFGEGLLLLPTGDRAIVADVVAIPDADQTPEQLAGLADGIPAESQFARRLAENGCRVVIPTLVSRTEHARMGGGTLSERERLHRSAFELGRHIAGYEVQKVLAIVDAMSAASAKNGAEVGPGNASSPVARRIGIAGYGEGGLLALLAAAVDPRIDATLVSGYVDDRNGVWRQPLERSAMGLLDEFGDAEIISLVAPRAIWVTAGPGPKREFKSSAGAPAELKPADDQVLFAEYRRARALVRGFPEEIRWPGHVAGRVFTDPARQEAAPAGRTPPWISEITLGGFLNELSAGAQWTSDGKRPTTVRKIADPTDRLARQIAELDRFNQALLAESPYLRAEFMRKLDFSSLPAYEKSCAWYREYFAAQVIGRFDDPLLPPKPKSRKAYETDAWTAYEVTLDVFPDVFAYGLLLLPKDLKPGERRPVVVCQHGLEGRPQDTIGPQGSEAYSAFAGRLAERGFITFAPQNIYIFRDRFRSLQRKAYPLGKTLFSIMVPQHRQITDWLKSLPFVDRTRIGFYGLSYGGKSAMRIPPLVENYCLSICSADFNEWVWKNASSRSPYSYADKGEYEIFEWDLGSSFNYAEMAALIAPRPFMVERGHFDGVAPDDTVAYEFAKVRHLYRAKLKLPEDRCQIEWFVGPHTINGQGTFEFLHRHLNWPTPKK